MPRYQYQTSYFQKRSHARRLRFAALVGVFGLLVFGGLLGFDLLKQSLDNTKPESRPNSVAVQSASINIFTTPFFKFEADDNWREVSGEFKMLNDPNLFIYRRYDNSLIEHELWITVNRDKPQILDKQYPTRVLPVTIDGDGRLVVNGPVSEHCEKAIPKNGSLDVQVVSQSQVKYTCWPNNTAAYNVVVGLVGGTEQLPLIHDGQQQIITILYRNVTAYPESSELEQIIKTFRSQ